MNQLTAINNCSSLDCDIAINDIAPGNRQVLKTQVIKDTSITLGRNLFKDLTLQVANKKSPSINFTIQKNYKLYKKFANLGKAGIDVSETKQVLISNCAPQCLSMFLGLLDLKGKKTSSAKNFVSSANHRLKNGLVSSQFEDISPLTITEANTYGKRKENAYPGKTPTRPGAGTSTGALKRKSCDGLEDNTEEFSDTASVSSVSSTASGVNGAVLNKEQQYVVSCVLKGESVFFTGSAGTGKSFLLKRLIRQLPPDTTFATASTGIAACHINGTTLHSFAGIGTATGAPRDCLMTALSKPNVVKNWKKCRILIIDEISMIDADFFDKVEYVARKINGNDMPFGGIQLVISGDFLQLPPVSKFGEPEKKFCFQSERWKECMTKCIELRDVKRQSDQRFIKILQLIRIGQLPETYKQLLLNSGKNVIEKHGIIATTLCTHKEDVATINTTKLEALPGVGRVFRSSDRGDTKRLNMVTPVPDVLVLKPGAQVMLLKNINIAQGLVNGARGVVVGFNPDLKDYPIVKFISGLEKTIEPEKWIVNQAFGDSLVRKQFPLNLAWSISIHKSQGMTLDCVSMSLSKVFECGQAYVALSRAKSLEYLRVTDIDTSSVKANPKVVEYYVRLRKEALKSRGMEPVPLGGGAKRMKTM